ncbi:MAG: class F sortase [Alicyclobacillus sp.]|nr:class F sortase [Alicyclobacillus sp.]
MSVTGLLVCASVFGSGLLHRHYRVVNERIAETVAKQTQTAQQVPPAAAQPPVIPVEISIPRLHREAPVVPVGLDASGRMATVPNAGVIAWYEGGAVPGGPGNAILAGHRDWAGELGVFWQLESLRKGDVVLVRFSDGHVLSLTVASDAVYNANFVPASAMNVRGASRTTLITCVGDFIRSAGGYQSRVVVTLRATGHGLSLADHTVPHSAVMDA